MAAKRLNRVDRQNDMANGPDPNLDKTRARAGTTPHMTRYILGFSMLLIVAVFAIILFVAA